MEVRLVRAVGWVLTACVGIPLLLLGTVVVFAVSLVWPSRLIDRWRRLLQEDSRQVEDNDDE